MENISNKIVDSMMNDLVKNLLKRVAIDYDIDPKTLIRKYTTPAPVKRVPKKKKVVPVPVSVEEAQEMLEEDVEVPYYEMLDLF
jgi:hypothetical protein